ncbi:hypothetical protein LIN78_07180 [Leeia sp. TBRC 13508]|uniref:PABS domain-containing protein n=1 Tax=Leeia speluncae TaxID=2884804 RepID=A0ABS8D526_9NEIS|nr:hypothetical protein [Leeia speluncae]MCB6183325.1 hypothetical protein [Leeia speluncae]
MALFRTRRNTAGNESVAINVSEKGGIRYLHLGSETVQSAMRISDPAVLVLPYTHCMMGFMLFNDRPKRVTVLGLGGASLPKFMHKHIPNAVIESVELHPEVVSVAHSAFLLPVDQEKLPVHIGCGGAFIADKTNHTDVIMVDGFGSHKLADNLCSDAFYHNAKKALTENGIMMVNLWRSSPQFQMLVERIRAIFEGQILLLPDYRHGNTIVMAFNRTQHQPGIEALHELAEALSDSTGLAFNDLLIRLVDENPHSKDNLLI